MTTRVSLYLAVSIATLVLGHEAAAQPATSLGTLGGPYRTVNAINDRRQVVGFANDAAESWFHVFLWEDGVMRDLGSGPDRLDYGADINDRGQIAGTTGLQADGSWWAGIWQDEQLTILAPPPGAIYCTGSAINRRGVVVGSCTLQNGNTFDVVAARWGEDGMFSPIEAPPGVRLEPIDVNDRGVVVGIATRADGTRFPFVWEGGVAVDLNSISDRPFDRVVGINRHGQIAGVGSFTAGRSDGLIFDRGRTTVIPTLPGSLSSVPYGINDHGDVTGANNGRPDGFVWSKGRLFALGPLPGGSAAYGVAINDRGDVAGHATEPPDTTFPTAVIWPRATHPR